MFTKENGKTALTMLVVVMAGLAIHQAVVAPMIAKKLAGKTKV